MTHKLNTYGSEKIAYCTLCSAEGEELLYDCPGRYVSGLPFFKHMTREQFEKEFGPVEEKFLDQMKQTAK
jgi:hypothetical protein